MDPKPQLPKYLILDLKMPLLLFKAKMSSLEDIDFDTVVVVGDILADIVKEGDALHNVYVTNQEYLEQVADGPNATDVSNYINARLDLATSIIDELSQMRAYVNGVFYYQVAEIQKCMVVLEKLMVPVSDGADLNAQDKEHAQQKRIALTLDSAVRRFAERAKSSAGKPPGVAREADTSVPVGTQGIIRGGVWSGGKCLRELSDSGLAGKI